MAFPCSWSGYSGEDIVITDTMTPVANITGWTLELTVRRSRSGAALLTKTSGGGGIVITDAVSGVYTITFSATDTAALGEGLFAFETSRTDSGHNSVVSTGNLVVQLR